MHSEKIKEWRKRSEQPPRDQRPTTNQHSYSFLLKRKKETYRQMFDDPCKQHRVSKDSFHLCLSHSVYSNWCEIVIPDIIYMKEGRKGKNLSPAWLVFSIEYCQLSFYLGHDQMVLKGWFVVPHCWMWPVLDPISKGFSLIVVNYYYFFSIF